MLLPGVRLWGLIICIFLYCLVFFIARVGIVAEQYVGSQVQPALLLFLVPGMAAAWFSRESPIFVALAGALGATPVCLMMAQTRFMNGYDFWQELAYDASAIFWCGSGSLLIMLWRAFYPGSQHLDS